MPLFKSDGRATSRVLNANPHPNLRGLSMALGFAMSMSACGGGGGASAAGTPTGLEQVSQRGFPLAGPWVSFYGGANAVDLEKMSRTYRIFDVDADPHIANFTPTQIQKLQNGGQNKVLSYLNIGSCEDFRSYWKSVPPGFVSCSDNQAAQLGRYAGYADEVWMNPGNAAYQKLIVEHVAPSLVAQGIDGFYFDNLEIVEHGTETTNGPCDADCSQGGLNLVAMLRNKYPNLLFVMQNATGERTRLGMASSPKGTVDFPSLLDGIAHEEVYKPSLDASAESALLKWAAMGLKPGGRSFWIGTLDYVGNCANQAEAQAAFRSSRARGFAPSVSDASASQQTVCYWPPSW